MSDYGDVDVTGDPQLDVQYCQSPKRDFRRKPQPVDYLAPAKHGREKRQRRRQPQPMAPHVAQAVERDAPGLEAGWYRVDVWPDGEAAWTPVDAPGDGPRVTVQPEKAQEADRRANPQNGVSFPKPRAFKPAG